MALAWLLKQGSDIVPIPGTTKVNHLEENAKAAEINFSPAEWKTVDEILQKNPIVGNRYPDEMMKMVQTP